jgi:hypothetical protein
MAIDTIVSQVKAELLFHQRIDYADSAIAEMVIWRVPAPVPPSVRGLKYSLFCGRPGVREVGCDNERGTGFNTVEKLMADFWSDVRALRGDK